MRKVQYQVYMTVYSPQLSNFSYFIFKNVKNYSPSMQGVEIPHYEALRHLKRNFINLLFLLAWYEEGGEYKIYQFSLFSVYFREFWLRQGGSSFYGSHKGDKRADTYLIFQFCLPNPNTRYIIANASQKYYESLWYLKM